MTDENAHAPAPVSPLADLDHLPLAEQSRVFDRHYEFERALGANPDLRVTADWLHGFEGPARDVLLHLLLLEEYDCRVGQVADDMIRRQDTVADQSAVETALSGRTEGVSPPDAGPDTPRFRRYVVQREVGRGGMAVVYRAFDRKRKGPVAIKILHDQWCRSVAMVEAFRKEVRLLVELQGAAVPAVFDTGCSECGRPFVAMELVTGTCIRNRLPDPARPFHFDPAQVQLTGQVCRSLAPIHARDICHLDLSPDNIHVTHEGRVTLLDLGLGRDRNADGVGVDGGTPDFIAPEKARRRPHLYSPRTDVFSIGCLLLWQLTGRPLYPDTTNRDEKLRLVGDGELAAPLDRLRRAGRRHGVPKRLVALVSRCLAVDPATRPANAGEVAGEIEAYFRSVEKERTDARVRFAWSSGLAALLLVAVAAGGAVWFFGRRAAEEAQLRATAEAERQYRDGEADAGDGRWHSARAKWRPLVLDPSAGIPEDRRVEIRLRLVRAAAFLGDEAEVRSELDSLDRHPLEGRFRGRIDFERAIQHLHAANRHTLSAPANLTNDNPFDASAVLILRRVQNDPSVPPADRATARGLLAHTADDAIREYQEALALEPFHAYAGPYLLVTCLLAGRLAEATARADAWCEATRDDPLPWFYKAFICSLQGKAREADAALDGLTRASGGGRVIPLSTVRACEGTVRAAQVIHTRLPESAVAGENWGWLASLVTAAELLKVLPAGGSPVATLFSIPIPTSPRKHFAHVLAAYDLMRSDPKAALNLIDGADQCVAQGAVLFLRGLLCRHLGQASDAEKAFLACCKSDRQLWDVRGVCHLSLARHAAELAARSEDADRRRESRLGAKEHLREACRGVPVSKAVADKIREITMSLHDDEFAKEIEGSLRSR